MENNKYKKTKKAVSLVVAAGVGDIIWNVVKDTMPEDTPFIRKAFLYLGSWALGGLLGDKAGEWASDLVASTADVIVDSVKEEMVNEQ